MRSKRLFSVLLCLALSLSLLPGTALAAGPIELNKSEKTLYLNENNPLKMESAFDFDVINLKGKFMLTWSVKGEEILDVNQDGVVTGKKVGTATVYCHVEIWNDESRENRYLSASVTVKENASSVAITTAPESRQMTVGQRFRFEASAAAASGGTSTDIVGWSISGGDGIATVDSDGTVTACKPGTFQILARTYPSEAPASTTAQSDWMTITVAPARYEAEVATLSGSTVTDNAAASGGKYVMITEANQSITFDNVSVSAAGNYTVTIRYKCAAEKHNYLSVNRERQPELIFAESSTFTDLETTVKLSQGLNEIAIEADWGWIDVDYIDIALAAYNTGNFTVSGGIPGRDYSYDSGLLTIKKAGMYEIGMKPGVETIEGCIAVNTDNDNDEVTLDLNGVNIEVAQYNTSSALTIKNAIVTLYIIGTSSLKGCNGPVNDVGSGTAPSGYAGIIGDFTLESGTLHVRGGTGGSSAMGGTGGTGGAGIDGTVTITNGNLHVNGGQGGVGSSADFEDTEGFTHGKGGDGGSGVTGNVIFTAGSFIADGGSGGTGTSGRGSSGRAVAGSITVSDGFVIRAGSSSTIIASGGSTDASYVTIEPAPTYPLTVDLNGGSGSTIDGDYAENAVVSIDAGTRSGYRFAGWTSSNGGTFENADSASTTFTMPGHDTTVTAGWKAVGGDTDYCTLSFVSDGGSVIADFTRAGGREIDLTLARFQPERAGYRFTGWYADEALTQRLESIRLTRDTRIFAGWEQNAWETPFADVKESDWFYGDVRYVYESGLMTGPSDALFSPAAPMTRAMLITALWRMAGEPTINYAMRFGDVAPDAYYAEAVRWAAGETLVNGYDAQRFCPSDPVTREQLVTILHRYAQYKELDVSIGEETNILSYNDAFDIAQWAIPAMQWVCGAGVVQGDGGGNLAPQGGAQRCEVAAMLHRFTEME